MRKRVLSSIAIALCFPTVAAAQELILLDFQIRLNGTLVGSPILRVQEDSTGSLRLPDVLDIALAPTREDGGEFVSLSRSRRLLVPRGRYWSSTMIVPAW